MGALLRQRYGFREYYSEGQVLTTAELMGLGLEGKECAVAMYVAPQEAQGILVKLGSTKLAKIVRDYMIGASLGFSGGNDGSSDLYNPFMHAPTGHEGHHGASHGSESSSGHWGDSGGGDHGGGHH